MCLRRLQEAELFGGAPPLQFALEMSADSVEWSSVYKGGQCTAMVPLAPLLPFARYTFRVRATSSGGSGPWSELLKLRTPAWRPSGPKVKSVQTDSCELNWSRPPRCERASTEWPELCRQEWPLSWPLLSHSASLVLILTSMRCANPLASR